MPFNFMSLTAARVASTLAIFSGLAVWSGCDKPSWGSASRGPADVCYLCRTADYVLKASPKKIDPPVKIRLVGKGQREPTWYTPVEWQVLQTLLTNPLAGAQLAPLPATMTTIASAPYTDATTTKIFGVTLIDGYYLMEPPGFAEGPQADGGTAWTWPAGSESFATEAELAQALQDAGQRPECARIDWVGHSRARQEARFPEDFPRDGGP